MLLHNTDKMKKGKSLLIETIGEESFIEFENGFPVKIPSPDGYTYWMTKQTWGIKLQRMNGDSLSEGIIKATKHKLYDTAASFAISGKLGKINWKCGNIDVKLPKQMPEGMPKNLSFITFFLSKTHSLLITLFSILNDTFNWVLGNVSFSLMIVSFVFLVLFSFIWMAHPTGEEPIWSVQGIIYSFILTASLFFYRVVNQEYLNWKKKWLEVRSKIED